MGGCPYYKVWYSAEPADEDIYINIIGCCRYFEETSKKQYAVMRSTTAYGNVMEPYPNASTGN